MNLKRFILYAIFGIAVSLVFLIFLFPGERAALVVCEKLNTQFTNGHIVIEKVLPSFPIGLKAVNPVFIFDDGNQIKMSFIALYPKIFSLYKDVKQIEVKAQAYSGTINGTVGLSIVSTSPSVPPSPSPSQSPSPPPPQLPSSYNIALEMIFTDMNIQDLRHSVANIDILSSFKLSGNLNYNGSIENIIKSSGNGNIQLSQCSVNSDNILLKQMGMGEANFTKINIEWNKKDDLVNIFNFNADGGNMKISLKGNMILKAPIDNSALNLKGSFQPDPSHLHSFAGLASLSMLFSNSSKGGIPFKINGTLKEPNITP